jgi:spermidine synthase
MGYTLRATLDSLPARAEVVVAEVFYEVVRWCRGPLSDLAGHPLEDARVEVRVADVWTVLGDVRQTYDVVLLDVDNGPLGLSLASNERLYGAQGLARVLRCLRPGGRLAVWSASPDPDFERRLRRQGLDVNAVEVPVSPHRPELVHTVFVAG